MGPSRNSMRSAAALVAAVAAQQAAIDMAHHEAAARAQQSLQQAQMSPLTMGSSTPASLTKRQGQEHHPGVQQAPAQHAQMTVTPEGGSIGQTQVRKASAVEKLAAQRVMDPNGGMGNSAHASAAVQRGLARVGHEFTIAIRPDGTIVHEYGKDVAPELREVVVGAARRHATGGTLAP